jgi:hypothetical protein
MPTYEYQCACGHRQSLVVKVDDRDRLAPSHCGKVMPRRLAAPMIRPVFTPYRAVAGDRRYIKSESAHRDFLKEFGLIEIGNDSSMAPPPDDQDREAARQKESKEALADLAGSPELLSEDTQ